MKSQTIFGILKQNYKSLIVTGSIFLISLFSQTFAELIFMAGHKEVAIILWIIFALSTLAIFFAPIFLLKFTENFCRNGKVVKFWAFVLLLLSSFTIFTVVFVIFRYLPSLHFLDFVALPCIIHILFSTTVLGVSILLIR